MYEFAERCNLRSDAVQNLIVESFETTIALYAPNIGGETPLVWFGASLNPTQTAIPYIIIHLASDLFVCVCVCVCGSLCLLQEALPRNISGAPAGFRV